MAEPTINKSCFCSISVTGFSRYARTLRILAEDAYMLNVVAYANGVCCSQVHVRTTHSVLSSVPPGMPLNIEISVVNFGLPFCVVRGHF